MKRATVPVCLGGEQFSASVEMLDQFYWWMAERHRIHVRRGEGQLQPWTSDSVMQQHRFCNVFRVFDRVTQYLIHNVIENGDQDPRETMFRIILFRFFNRVETWERLEAAFGGIRLSTFHSPLFHRLLAAAYEDGEKLYGGAYIIPSPRITPGPAYENHLLLLARIKDDGVIDKILQYPTPSEAHSLLKSYPGIGDFIAYQLVLDITLMSCINWDENSFTAAGPGSREGLHLIFDTSMNSPTLFSLAIMYLYQEQGTHWRRLRIDDIPHVVRRGQISSPQVPDIEHALCEFAKYTRLSLRRDGHQPPVRRGPFSPSSSILTRELPSKWTAIEPPLVPAILEEETQDSIDSEDSDDSDMDDTEYEVSHIVAERRCRDGSKEYRIRWVGYAPNDDTWLPEDSLGSCQDVLMEWLNRPKRPGRKAKDSAQYFH